MIEFVNNHPLLYLAAFAVYLIVMVRSGCDSWKEAIVALITVPLIIGLMIVVIWMCGDRIN